MSARRWNGTISSRSTSSERPFRLTGDSGTLYLGDTLVIATGAQARWLNLPSEEHLKGKGVSACATCDGFFYRGKKVVVIGGGNTAVEEALYMTNHSHDVTLIHRRDSLRAEKILQDRLFAHPNIKVMWNREVAEFVGGGEPEGLVAVDLRDTQTGAIERLDTEGAFVAIGHSPATELFKGHLDLDADGYIQVETGTHPDQRARRLRLRRRDGQDLPPGGDRRRHRLHGRARRREIPRRGRFRSARRRAALQDEPAAMRLAAAEALAPAPAARRRAAAPPRRRGGRRCGNRCRWSRVPSISP